MYLHEIAMLFLARPVRIL